MGKVIVVEFVTLDGVVEDPDGDLVARIADGDHAAARALMARHLPRVLNLSRRMLGSRAEAEDVAQDVFLRVWTHAARWQPGAAKFETWLHRVAMNLCYDRLRRKKPTNIDALENSSSTCSGLKSPNIPAASTRCVSVTVWRVPKVSPTATSSYHLP